MGSFLALLPFVPILLLMLILLVVVHELGHFLAAKRFGVEAPEFGIGFPPRLFTFWKTDGWMQIQGRKIIIPKKVTLPEVVNNGSWVTFKTETVEGRELLTSITPVDDESRGLAAASQIQALDRGTEFTLNAIPLGGFVRMNEDESSTSPTAFVNKPAWQRGIILVAGVVFNFIFAFVAFAILAMFIPQLSNPVANTTIQGLVANSPAAQADLRVHDTIVTVNGVDVRNNREKMVSVLGTTCNVPVTLGVERPTARNIENLQVQLTPRPSGDLPCALGVLIGQELGVQIAQVKPGSLADQAGLREGDALARIGDFSMIPPEAQTLTQVNDEKALAKFITDHSKIRTTLIATYVRDNEAHEVKITIPENLPADQADLGLSFHLNPAQAVAASADTMYSAITLLPRTLSRAFTSSLAGQNSGLIGPIGMTQVLQQTVPTAGFVAIVSLLIEFSLSLAIFNLFPIPGLDGGRLVFVIAEIITRGRRLNPRIEAYIHLAGFAVLLMLVVFVFYGDITRIIAGRTPFNP